MVNPLFLLWQYRISMMFLMTFQLLFLHLRYNKYISGMIVLGSLVCTGVLDYLYFMTELWPDDFLVITVMEIVIVQITAYVLSEYRDFRVLFTGISSSTYVLPGNIISMAVFAYKHKIWLALLIQIAIHLALLVLLIVALRRYYLAEMETDTKSWKNLCMIPALFYAEIYTLACWPNSIYDRNDNWLSVFLSIILMGVIYIMLIKDFSKQRMENELERSNEFLETYAEGLRREADIFRESEENLRLLRHDSRHVYQMIGLYLEEGNTEQIKALLEQMDAKLESISIKHF